MPIDIASVAPLNGWRQIGASHWKELNMHRFSASADGQLEHHTDDVLRATVPPEGWDDYVKAWPDAADLVGQLRKAPQSAVDAASAAIAAAAGIVKDAGPL